MTRQETFKRRIRQRMEKTGERYGAARRVLFEQSSTDGARKWASEPEMADETLREATGRGWDEWCEFDDIPEAPYFAPPLTTVRQEFSRVGTQSMALLLSEIKGETQGPLEVVVDADLVVRDSTAPPK